MRISRLVLGLVVCAALWGQTRYNPYTGKQDYIGPSGGVTGDCLRRNAAGLPEYSACPGATGGTTETASNTGSLGTGIFKTKNVDDLQFYKINSANNLLTIALSGTDFVQMTINQANFALGSIGGTLGVSQLSATGTKDATTYLAGDNTFKAFAHAHAGTDITSGVVAPDRLGTGGSAGLFLRYDGTWASTPGGASGSTDQLLRYLAGVATGVTGTELTSSGDMTVASITLNGSGAGSVALVSGTAPAGITGTTRLVSESGDLLGFRQNTGSVLRIATMTGHLCGTQSSLAVCSFGLTSNASLAGYATTQTCANDTSTGTTVNLLAKLGATGNCILNTTTDTTTPAYIVVSGAGTTGSAETATSGYASCIFDDTATINHYAVASTITNGRCHSVASPSAGVRVIGIVRSSVASAGNLGTVWVEPRFVASAGGGGSIATTSEILKGDGAGAAVAATPCTDFYDVGCTIAGADLPEPDTSTKGGVQELTCPVGKFINKVDGVSTCDSALQTTSYTATETFSNDGSVGTNIGTTDTQFTVTHLVAANKLAAGTRIKVFFTMNYTSAASGNTTFQVFLKRAATNTGIAAGTALYSSGNITMTNGCTNCGGGGLIVITGTAAPSNTSNTTTDAVAMNLGSGSGSTWRNGTAQPVSLDTDSQFYIGITVKYAATTAASSVVLRDFFVEYAN